jgi:hypothetical protein
MAAGSFFISDTAFRAKARKNAKKAAPALTIIQISPRPGPDF